MNEITIYDYNDAEIRTFEKNGEPWFVAKDVCDVLGIANSRDALSSLDEDEKGVGNADTLGGKQRVQIVNEPGLYRLVFKSRTEAAKEFKRWVTHEVLPEIRKTGGYQFRSEDVELAVARKEIELMRRINELLADKAEYHRKQLELISASKRKPLTDFDRSEILRMTEDGMIPSQIGEALGRSASTIRTELRRQRMAT